jgi:N-methylhydantoinase B
MFGGEPGASGRFRLQDCDGSIVELPPKTGRRNLAPDQAVIIETPGAGGYGEPAERTAEHIEQDRASEKFSAKYLDLHYSGKGASTGK